MELNLSSGWDSDIDQLTEDELSSRWRDQTEAYVTAVNSFVRRGMTEGWKNIDRTEEPKDTTGPMADAVLNAIRRANEVGKTDGLHERFPRSHSPFWEMLRENGQSLPVVFLLDDGRMVLQVGTPSESGHIVLIDGDSVERLSPSIVSIGRSPNRKFFAVAQPEGISVHQGWDGPVKTFLKWPTGQEAIPQGFVSQPIQQPPTITRIVPFNTGEKLLLVGPDGIFVLTANGTKRLLPTDSEMKQHCESSQANEAGEPITIGLSMEHGTISPDGKLIAVGHQDSLHYVVDSESLKIIGEIGNMSEYPHHAAFSADGSMIAFNSCHFYHGETIGLPTKLLPGIKTQPYELDNRIVNLEGKSRVYAAVSRNDEFIIGDASGYLRAFDLQGTIRWQHFIGSTICDLDISRDERQLIVTTYAGFLCVLDLDTGEADPFVIGTATHRERRRWLFWKNEPKPLIW